MIATTAARFPGGATPLSNAIRRRQSLAFDAAIAAEVLMLLFAGVCFLVTRAWQD